MKTLIKILTVLSISGLLSAGAAYADCTWGWEEDSCQDVQCPGGCYDTGIRGATASTCQLQGRLCCNR